MKKKKAEKILIFFEKIKENDKIIIKKDNRKKNK